MTELNQRVALPVGSLGRRGMPAGLKRQEGQTIVEYALILAFIAVVVLVAVTFLGTQISSFLTSVGSAL